MNVSTDNLEYVEIDGKKEISIVRTNLMNQQGYTPYCGAVGSMLGYCSNPRTRFIFQDNQFHCPECGWVSQFPKDFIDRYKAKWNLKIVHLRTNPNQSILQ